MGLHWKSDSGNIICSIKRKKQPHSKPRFRKAAHREFLEVPTGSPCRTHCIVPVESVTAALRRCVTAWAWELGWPRQPGSKVYVLTTFPAALGVCSEQDRCWVTLSTSQNHLTSFQHKEIRSLRDEGTFPSPSMWGNNRQNLNSEPILVWQKRHPS